MTGTQMIEAALACAMALAGLLLAVWVLRGWSMD